MKNNFWQNKKILITGIHGFVGSNLCKKMLKNKAIVYGLHKFNSETSLLKIEKIKGYNSVQIIDNIKSKSLILDLFIDKEIEVCFHLAAQVEINKAIEEPYYTFDNNVNLTLHLLEASRISKKLKCFIMSSTDKVYGDIAKNLLPYKEKYLSKPKYPYEVSKYICELMSKCYFENYNLPVITTRTCNLYGPGQMNFSAIIPYTIECLLKKEKFIARSDGSMLRDYLFIDDWIQSLESIVTESYKNKKLFGNLYNFGTNKPYSTKEIVHMLCNLIDPKKINEINKSFKKIKNNNEILYQSMDIKKSKKYFYNQKTNIKNALNKTINWYKNNL
ncbi:GDP-mannose 4,6-dehydratase [Alphaproteobacteria bacterium]|nr:GDP-mannose 4,6-dehydratase [Alphaproteobacteria bacterium]